MTNKIFGNIASSNIPRKNDDDSMIKEIESIAPEIMTNYRERRDELTKCASILENHFDLVDEHRRPAIFSQISYGYRRSSEGLSWALAIKRNVSRKLKMAEAIAGTDGFYDYMEKQKVNKKPIKDTEYNKKWYIEIDSDVAKLRELDAVIDPIIESFSSFKFQFIQGQSTLKAMYYGNKDSSNLNSATVAIDLES